MPTEYAFPTMEVETPRCFHCGQTGTITISCEAYTKWQTGAGPIQQFMPEMPLDQREQLISGTHPVCWNELFPPDEDDDDE